MVFCVEGSPGITVMRGAGIRRIVAIDAVGQDTRPNVT